MNSLISFIVERGNIVFLALVFISIVLLTAVVFGIVTSTMGVRRRAQAAAVAGSGDVALPGSPGQITKNAFSSLEDLLPIDQAAKSEIRRMLALAGFEGTRALVIYQLVRVACGVILGFYTALHFDDAVKGASFLTTALAAAFMTVLGFYLPKTLVSMRRDKICQEHRDGFPDFLDLMVICTDAGVGVDAAIDRVSKELVTAHPSLARHLAIMSLELRAGRSLREALDHLADRLGIPEAKSFATLIQQSDELGTSLIDSLRVYSDEMRAKRYARAEEKAYGLPAKLVIPLGLFVFPVILGVTLVPVVIRLYKALGI